MVKPDEEDTDFGLYSEGDTLKKVGDLMKELGFNADASDSAKEAFLKYLIKSATGHNVQTPTEKKLIAENPQQVILFPQQLKFDLDEDGSQQENLKIKRSHKNKL